MNLQRFALSAVAVVSMTAAVGVPGLALADSFPSKPIRIVLTLPPGGALDAMARLISEPLSQSLGQPVIVDNRPGAGGNVATMAVARAPADGYTLLYTTDSVVLNPLIYRDAGYQISDLVPVAGVGTGAQVLSTNADTPYQNLDDLVAAAKEAPGTIAYGTPGTGQPAHLIGTQFEGLAGIELIHAPYRGGGPAVTDAVGGQIPLVISSLVAALPHYDSGRLRPLALSSAERSDFRPEIPTFNELGYPVIAENWSGIFAPAGTPQEVLVTLNRHISQIVEGEAFQNTLRRIAFNSEGLTGLEEFQQLVADSQQLFEDQVRDLDLSIE